MAQFDVYANPSKKGRQAYPLIVDVQNPIIEGLSTRLVIPLTNQKYLQHQTLAKLTPDIEYEGQIYLLLTPQLTSMPSHLLKDPIGTIKSLRNIVVDAIDFALTGV
ncbi:CcdB family protein [Paraglaciecola sp. MB-3u-78]|uniref:CcdB family protein n=1 Tax=Paraglaciecola sp. MB-3u-78 TaxID=2058332 RepID=UPI000C34BECB|nr:CcdB family protein [Paraglaciecola sp. MB-3u-78]PKG93293.1 plasmid maintenance protein CcdB [Paraglaciecola sp. MB-3u-78]